MKKTSKCHLKMKDEKNQVAWNSTVPKEPEMGTNMNINQLFHKPYS